MVLQYSCLLLTLNTGLAHYAHMCRETARDDASGREGKKRFCLAQCCTTVVQSGPQHYCVSGSLVNSAVWGLGSVPQ